jgi:hypothetical protein
MKKTRADLMEEYVDLLLRNSTRDEAADVLVRHASKRETQAADHLDFAAMLRARAKSLRAGEYPSASSEPTEGPES